MAKKNKSNAGPRKVNLRVVPTVIAASPIILDAAHLAADIKNGVPAGQAAGLFLQRLRGLYMAMDENGKFSLSGVQTTFNGMPISYGPLMGYGAMVGAVLVKMGAKKAGLSNLEIMPGVLLF